MSRLRVVIIGAGLAGIAAASGLRRAPVDLTVIDRCGQPLFDPSLYRLQPPGFASQGMSAALRAVARDNPDMRVLLDEVWGIDPTARRVRPHTGQSFAYDRLVLATGARRRPIGDDAWAAECGIEEAQESTAVRRKVLLAVRRAEHETDVARRRALLTFVVIGGGPAGIELARTVADLARRAAVRDTGDYEARVLLVESARAVLSDLPPNLSVRTGVVLRQLGVEVMLGRRVTGIAPDHIMVGSEQIDAFTAIWAAGVRSPPAGGWLGARIDALGRLAVAPDLSVPGHDAIYAIGDTARFVDGDGRILPPLAAVAEQQGRHVATAIASGIDRPFRYRDPGSRAAIARRDGLRAATPVAHEENDHVRHAIAR